MLEANLGSAHRIDHTDEIEVQKAHDVWAEAEQTYRDASALAAATHGGESTVALSCKLKLMRLLMTMPHGLGVSSVLSKVVSDQATRAAEEPEKVLPELLEMHRRILGPGHAQTCMCALLLARLLSRLHRSGDAECMLRPFEAAAAAAAGHKLQARVATVLGATRCNQGGYADGLANAEDAWGLLHPSVPLQSASEPTNTDETEIMLIAAVALRGLQRYDEAHALLQRLSEAQKRTLGRTNPSTIHSTCEAAAVLCDLGRYDEAEALIRWVLATCQSSFSKGHPYSLCTLNNLALVLKCQGRKAEAETALCAAIHACEREHGETHVLTVLLLRNLCKLLEVRCACCGGATVPCIAMVAGLSSAAASCC